MKKRYGSLYQKLTGIVHSDKFKKQKKRWYERFEEYEVSIPATGFKNVADYKKWEEKLCDKSINRKKAFASFSPIRDIAQSFSLYEARVFLNHLDDIQFFGKNDHQAVRDIAKAARKAKKTTEKNKIINYKPRYSYYSNKIANFAKNNQCKLHENRFKNYLKKLDQDIYNEFKRYSLTVDNSLRNAFYFDKKLSSRKDVRFEYKSNCIVAYLPLTTTKSEWDMLWKHFLNAKKEQYNSPRERKQKTFLTDFLYYQEHIKAKLVKDKNMTIREKMLARGSFEIKELKQLTESQRELKYDSVPTKLNKLFKDIPIF